MNICIYKHQHPLLLNCKLSPKIPSLSKSQNTQSVQNWILRYSSITFCIWLNTWAKWWWINDIKEICLIWNMKQQETTPAWPQSPGPPSPSTVKGCLQPGSCLLLKNLLPSSWANSKKQLHQIQPGAEILYNSLLSPLSTISCHQHTS